MYNKTKLLHWVSILLLSIMMLSVFSSADSTEATSSSQEDEWTSKGWARIHEAQPFKSDKNLTRVELVALINSLFDYKEQSEVGFADVSDQSLYYKEISKALKAGYIAGRGDNTFAPEAEVTKVEAYIMIARILKLDMNHKPEQMLQFKDSDEVPNWGTGAVEALAREGLINDKSKVKPFEVLIGSDAVALLEKTAAKAAAATDTIPAVQEEAKGDGKSSLNLLGAFFVSIDNGKSADIGNIEAGSDKDFIIKLVFDRGVIRENWDNNQKQIKLQNNNGTIIKSEVFRIEGAEDEKSHIFIKPLEELKSGKTINLVIGKDFKANNGNSLSEDIIINFSVK